MTQAQGAVVRQQIVVDAPTARGFAVFTERFGDFKPGEHNLLGDLQTEVLSQLRGPPS